MKFKYNLRQKSLGDFFMLVGSVANCDCFVVKKEENTTDVIFSSHVHYL